MILAAFLIGLVLVAAGTAYAVTRGVGLWRQAKQAGGAFTSELSLFEERAARTEHLLTEADRSAHELQAAQERLRISTARLRILLDSLERSKRRTRWLAAFLPPR